MRSLSLSAVARRRRIEGRTNKNRVLALGCSGFQAELSIVVLEEAERSPTKQRLRRCGNGETKVTSRALIFCFFYIKVKERKIGIYSHAFRLGRGFSESAYFCFFFTCVEVLETSRKKKELTT